MTVIGITGGTGGGKTTALGAIRELGGIIIDCDEVYHRLTENSTEMLREIAENFPGVVSDGKLMRKELGKIVFADNALLLKLNEITHRFVKAQVSDIINEHRAKGDSLAAIDAIALFESGLDALCDFTVFVTAPKEVRAKRIMEREGISYDYAILRINAQKNDKFFQDNSTYTLINNFKSSDDFKIYCKKFFEEKVRCDK